VDSDSGAMHGLPAMSGLIAIDKPAGLTSRDCVNRVERCLRELFPKPLKLPKVGHAGTLDPLATGVLVMGIGSGVRLVPYIQRMTKRYDATFRLGCWSETGDLEGTLQWDADAPIPSLDAIHDAARSLTGDITQTPPATSAIRVNGKKAYKYARQGETVTVPSRVVRVDEIEITRYAYPDVDMTIHCGSGTYIRTLGMDLAIRCNTRAVMSRLRRTAIGALTIQRCVSLESVTPDKLPQLCLPLRDGVWGLPVLALSDVQRVQVMHGIKVPVADCPTVSDEIADGTLEAIVLDKEGELRAIVQREDDRWCPYRVFHHLPG
jgi:tRNA pseudouridine55 synthase